ncbi:MAG: ABC transporter permease [Firmicutes bacterium]|nr:ABC transporter permease [Bacillota bacterium]
MGLPAKQSSNPAGWPQRISTFIKHLPRRTITYIKQVWQANWETNLKVPLTAIAFGLLVGGLFVLSIGKNPLAVYLAILESVFGSPRSFLDVIGQATPLVFTGLSVAFAFRTGMFNIGAEGQYMMGLLAAGIVGIKLHFLPRILLLPACLLAGTLAGGLWGAIPGWLKAKRGVHEVINTIMMNYIALYLTNTLIMSAWLKAPGYQATYEVDPKALIGRFMGTTANWGILIAAAAVAVTYYLLWRTKFGYEIRATGHNPDAAKYAGINVPRRLLSALVISGMLAGLGGAIQTLGVKRRVFQLFGFTGVGLDGVAVALIGRNHPVGVVLAALLYGVLYRSSAMIQLSTGVPRQVIGIMQACIIFFVAADEIIKLIMKHLPQRGKAA